MQWLVVAALGVLALSHPAWSKHQSMHQSFHQSMHKSSMKVANAMHQVESAQKLVPNLVSIATELSAISLEMPKFDTVEHELEHYYRKYSKLIDSLEEDYEDPRKISSPAHFTEITQAHKKLAHAAAELAYVESEHSSLAEAQQQLQSVMFTDTKILTALDEYTAERYPSLVAASAVVSKAIVTDSSIVENVIHLGRAFADSATFGEALSGLADKVYSLPKDIDREAIEIVSSPSRLAGSALASFATCYPTVYADAEAVASYVVAHKTVESDVTAYLTVAENVQSVGYAVAEVLSQEQPSVYQDLAVVANLYQTWSSAPTALEFEQMLVDSSSGLASAAHVLQQSFYSSPSTAWKLIEGIEHPSLDSSLSLLPSEEAGHQTLVDAIEYDSEWVDNHPQDAAALSRYGSSALDALETESDLVNVLDSMSKLMSPSVYAASHSLAEIRSYVPSISTVMQSFEYFASKYPSITCAESIIARYDTSASTLVSDIWDGLTDKSSILSMKGFTIMTGQHPTLMSALHTILSAERSYPSLESIQSELLVAELTDSSLLTQWSIYTEESVSLNSLVSAY